jgi:transposase
VALPILEGGGTHADAGKALRLSGERIRQIIARHPELANVRRKTRGERVVGQVEALLQRGKLPHEAAKICGISMDTLRGLFRTHPNLGGLAAQNRALSRARRFDSVFQLVEGEGLTIRAACGKLGVKCRMAIYAVARTQAAQSRFPSLAQVPCRSRIPALRTGTGRLDLPHAG